LKWLDGIPLLPFAVAAILLALAPFSPEPHLWEKLKLLSAGQLTKPLDIFDLLLHGLPLTLLGVRLARKMINK
jgi:hypothetical protein